MHRTMLPWVARIAEAFPRHDFERFHTVVLPDLVAHRGHLVAAYVRDLAPLAFKADNGSAYCWQAAGQGVRVAAGTAGAETIVELSQATFSEHINQLLSAVGASQTGRARIAAGQLAHWRAWEPAIRSLIDGRPIYDAAVRETLVDSGGQHLPLDHSFSVDDSLDEMAHFLRTMGYLHIRSVFAPPEIAM
ncbi:MAG: hypothetical protein EON93_21675, partial [Burkholderiales bacterium]